MTSISGEIMADIIGDINDIRNSFQCDIEICIVTLYIIRGYTLKWFESYLTDRSQFVTYDGIQSEINSVKCGIPQSSILGPLLF